MTPTIRAARPDESQALTALLRRSKAHWGYSEGFIRRVISHLMITTQQIETAIAVNLAEQEGRVLGFYHLRDDKGLCWLEDLFIEPDTIGKGCGKLLFDHAQRIARTRGYREIQWESDPNAEAFYLKMGSERIGEKPSPVSGRVLPHMRIVLK